MNTDQTTPPVLIVEDDLPTQMLMRAILLKAGFTSEVASNGRAAIALLRDRRYAAVVLDMMLPEVDGRDVVEFLKTSPMPVPVIVCSAAGRTVWTALDSKVVKAIVRKPFDIDQFVDAVSAAAETPLQPTRVLIVDDDSRARYVLRAFLDSVEVIEVESGDDALERPEFYWDDAKTTPRVLSGRRLKSSTYLGDNVCHRGETTGYSCGYVDMTDYAPANATNNLCGGQACLPVFIRVSGGTNECAGGDSGGPFFASTVAFGITGGGTFDSTGRCLSAYYMSTDTISSGWSLLYGP